MICLKPILDVLYGYRCFAFERTRCIPLPAGAGMLAGAKFISCPYIRLLNDIRRNFLYLKEKYPQQ